MSQPVYDTPSNVEVTNEIVKVHGPDGVEVNLTADAAVETSNRLLKGATKALGRQLAREREEQEMRARRG